MNIPPKYEDVVAQLDIAQRHLDRMIEHSDGLKCDLESSQGREVALREELKTLSAVRNQNRTLTETVKEVEFIDVSLRQRLTVAEQREVELEGLLREVASLDPRGEFLGWQLDGKIDAALKPAEEGEGS